MNMMKVVTPKEYEFVGLHPKLQAGETYYIERNSIWFDKGNSYGDVYASDGSYICSMSLKYFTSV